MKEEKKEGDIDIRGIEKSKIPHKSCKVKYTIVAVISVTLLVAAVILIAKVWSSHKFSKCLVEVNLEEGDTLMYRVHQSFEVKGTDSQKESIMSIVGIQVVNKTSDAYWFLLKINTTFKDENEKVKSAITGYFRVRLSSGKNYAKDAGNETIESFELHGYPQTDGEFIRYLHGLLYQLLPAVRRDLYEEIDGQTDKNVKPENSPLFPGPVRMHRKANTKQSGDVLVKNQFNRSDLVNSSSDMDLDVKYTDSAAINKSNGMVSESNVYVSELLHFGEPIKTKDGRDVTTMKVTLYSHVTRIELDSTFFVEEETKALKMDLFVRLAVPTNEKIEINKHSAGKTVSRSWNSSSANDSVDGQRFSTQVPTTVSLERNITQDIKKGRVRRRARRRPVSREYKNALRSLLHDLTIPIEKNFTLFEKKVIGINIKGESTVWMKVFTDNSSSAYWALGSDVNLNVWGTHVHVYGAKLTNQEIEDEQGGTSLSGSQEIVKPSAYIGGSLEAYASVLNLRGGVFLDGTIVRVSLPTKLSYSSAKPVRQKWCLAANAELRAFDLEAGLFYQWWSLWYGDWGERITVRSFGRWEGYQENWKLFENCF